MNILGHPLVGLIAGCLLWGCALTPDGVQWGLDAGQEALAGVEAARDASGIDPSSPIGWRELVEGLIGTGFIANWVRNRNYTFTRQPKGESKA